MKPFTHRTFSLAITLCAMMFSSMAAAQAEASVAAEAGSSWQAFGQSVVRNVGQWFGRGAPAPVEEVQSVQVPDVTVSRGYERSLDRVALNAGNRNTSEITLSPELMLEAFPALGAMDDTLKLLDVSHSHTVLSGNFANGQSTGLDLSASYVWESARFGQFILSTNTTYLHNPLLIDHSLESVGVMPINEAAFGVMPELQSSLTFTWQIGNHSATAVTSYSDTMENFARLNADRLNIDQLNELVGQMTTLDLRYGYNVKAGRQGNASFSVGVRNLFDRRQFTPVVDASGRLHETGGRVAYGTIKYQF